MEECHQDGFKRWVLGGIILVALTTFSIFTLPSILDSDESPPEKPPARAKDNEVKLNAERALENIQIRMAKPLLSRESSPPQKDT